MLKNWISAINPWQKANEQPNYRIALDIGTEYVKAVYIEESAGVGTIIGVGRAQQDYANMDSGAIANIGGVVRCCRQAMTQGSVIAGIKPTQAVMGVAGQFVTGVTRSILRQRKRPERPLTDRELATLVAGVHREALHQATANMAEKMGFQKMDLELVNSAIVDISIDGYRVTNPLDFKGRNVEMTVFMVFAPLIHVSSMETVAKRLELDLVGLVAEPYALAASTFTDESYEFGSLVIDVGGGSTDIALIQRGGIIKTKMIAMGGRAFTKGIAQLARKSLREAEQLKLDYAAGVSTSSQIKQIVAADLEIWQDALLLGLKEIYQGQPLPPRIVLAGGGSGLPGIVETLTAPKLVESGLFAQIPKVKVLEADDVFGIADPKEFLPAVQDVTPKSIAFQACLVKENTKAIVGGVS